MKQLRLSRQFAGRVLLLLSTGLITASAGSADTPKNAGDNFSQRVKPFLGQYCEACHSGEEAEAGIHFESYTDSSRIQTDFEHWDKVRRAVLDRQMPPADADQPAAESAAEFLKALQQELDSYDCSADRKPGRVTIHRLNKAEYNNTIRDLTGLRLNPAAEFPSDDVGAGFDNIGDVLTIPPVLLEKYLSAAEAVAEKVMADPAARKRVFPHEPASPEQIVETARRNVREFATRAFRRPITQEEDDRLFDLMKFAWTQDSPPEEIMQVTIAAILSNPNFLFRIEQDPPADAVEGIRPLNDWELASRLSYFLWSSMPDKRLFELARDGRLTEPETLRNEARRMLVDPKSSALLDNFAGQWLQLRDIARLQPDPGQFPPFDADLRAAMRRETELFFENIIRSDRSVLEFLTADYTYLNERLGRHYGMDHVRGGNFRLVSLPAGRRGVLTHAGILTLTSNPTRTSPVKRGKWILENILGEPPPPPPANVPELEEGTETLGTLREQMEQHRSNPACAVCHTKMDALGFGMEHFNAVGQWRDSDGRFPINAAGELPGGRRFDGADELMEILAADKRNEFCRCFTEKLLTYALGRAVTSQDRCAVNDILKELQHADFRFSALVTGIVTSQPFTQRGSE
ncbi:MAG: DUF1592 domain-containing protein [Planctomycetaceae bacterium]|nr:DUF1592 domain-containing protein [Planctomycetaceae bacterium]